MIKKIRTVHFNEISSQKMNILLPPAKKCPILKVTTIYRRNTSVDNICLFHLDILKYAQKHANSKIFNLFNN